jgi:hypothetical protein
MRIRKIKLVKGDKIHIVYEQRNRNGSWDEFSLTSADEAAPAFHEALEILNKDVITIGELPEKLVAKIAMKGVSFSYGGENDTLGAVLTAEMILKNSNSGLVLNTPHKITEFYGDKESGDQKSLLPSGCAARLDAMIKEGEKYVKGNRAQTDMFDKKKK